MNPIISIENLSKQYHIGTKLPYKTFRETLMNVITSPARLFCHPIPSVLRSTQPLEDGYIWALKDVSFEVKEGEILGIIGRNGAGKTTLLKILSRVTEPTDGEVKIRGRVGSLLEVGTGFHPELTGRENVFLNGAILGMRKEEIKKKFDEIVAFAEVEKLLDTPVKRYSSGMYVRLAFAVAAHLEPEILVVDEVLAVGDSQFQKKCLGKMGKVAKEGRTVLFVSHNMPMIRFLCRSAILLNKGTLIECDRTDNVIEKYLLDNNKESKMIVNLSNYPRSEGDQKAILEAWIENDKGEVITEVLMGSSIKICFRFKSNKVLKNPGFGFGIENIYGQRIFSLSNYIVCKDEIEQAREGISVCYIPELTLLPGNYLISLSVIEMQNIFVDYVERAITLLVIANDVFSTGRMFESSQGVVYSRGEVYVK